MLIGRKIKIVGNIFANVNKKSLIKKNLDEKEL